MTAINGQYCFHVGDALNMALDTMNKRQRSNGILGIPSGFKQLDKIIGGLSPGDLIVLASRPSAGKTSFALNVARYSAVNLGTPTAFVTLEDSAVAIANRLLISEVGFTQSQIFGQQQFSSSDIKIAEDALTGLMKSPLYFVTSRRLTIKDLSNLIAELIEEKSVLLVIIDYIQLLRKDDGQHISNEKEMTSIAESLKEIAINCRIPIIALSQLTRMEDGQYEMTLMSSESVVHNIDVLMFLQPHYQKESPESYLLAVEKNNHGCGVVLDLVFNHERLIFSEKDDIVSIDISSDSIDNIQQ